MNNEKEKKAFITVNHQSEKRKIRELDSESAEKEAKKQDLILFQKAATRGVSIRWGILQIVFLYICWIDRKLVC